MSTILLGLDIGERYIGIAKAYTETRIASPLTTLENNDSFKTELNALLEEFDVSDIVIGLPRGMNGQDTKQTQYVKDFVSGLDLNIDVHYQDEAATSVKAEELLKASGKPYRKPDIDAMAATLILQDYMGVAV